MIVSGMDYPTNRPYPILTSFWTENNFVVFHK